jgi:hypothetical protein
MHPTATVIISDRPALHCPKGNRIVDQVRVSLRGDSYTQLFVEPVQLVVGPRGGVESFPLRLPLVMLLSAVQQGREAAVEGGNTIEFKPPVPVELPEPPVPPPPAKRKVKRR